MVTGVPRIVCAILWVGLLSWDASLRAEPVTTIRSQGRPVNRVDVVLLGDGYTSAELGQFASDAATMAGRFVAEAPFDEYRTYFNVHRVDVISPESGADHPSRGVFRSTALGATYDCSGIDRLICIDWTAVNDVLSRSVTFEQRDIVIVLVNDPEYGGSGGAIAVASTHSNSHEIVLHEIGHSFGLLADEYDDGPPACDNSSEPMEPNVTIQTSRIDIKWNTWIAATTPIPTTTFNPGEPGLYLGGKYCTSGMYRATPDSKMRTLFQPFDSVNDEQLIKRLYNIVSPIDGFGPGATLVTTRGVVPFAVSPLAPVTHALEVRWLLDEVQVSSSAGVSLDTRTLADGDHVLQAVVRDETPLVRNDPQQFLTDVRTWTVRVDATAPIVMLLQPAAGATLSGTVTVVAGAADNMSMARVEFWIDGVLRGTDVTSPYSFAWNTTLVANGSHALFARAVDWAGNAASSATRTVTVSNRPTGTLPTGWSSADIGAVGILGSASGSNGAFTIRGGGADIWGSADAFHYAYRPITGDVTIIGRVQAIDGTQSWTKVGVMIRASTQAGSPHASMLVTAGMGLAFQRRLTSGAPTAHTAGPAVVAPAWVKLQRVGNMFTASASVDGSTWSIVGTETIAMPASSLIGLAVTSHTTSALATGTFDSVAVRTVAPGWRSGDIGSVGETGGASYSNAIFRVKGSGADIWYGADEFQFVWRAMSGDGSITARVATLTSTEAWTKAGVMIRETLTPASRHASMFVTPGRGLAFQRRVSTAGPSRHSAGSLTTAPWWVRVVRSGNTFRAYASPDGTSWTLVGSETILMAARVYVGLAVTSHRDGTLATATFSGVTSP